MYKKEAEYGIDNKLLEGSSLQNINATIDIKSSVLSSFIKIQILIQRKS